MWRGLRARSRRLVLRLHVISNRHPAEHGVGIRTLVCMWVWVSERENERERMCVCVVCMCQGIRQSVIIFNIIKATYHPCSLQLHECINSETLFSSPFKHRAVSTDAYQCFRTFKSLCTLHDPFKLPAI